MIKRCAWVGRNSKPTELDVKYHDEEWGVSVHDDKILFEFLILEGDKAGLSWATILNKRRNYRKAYNKFDPKKLQSSMMPNSKNSRKTRG
jgi:DNA-3-methyladenine glycosylase I